MAGLENLFAVEPTLPNVQTYKMPDNPERWAEVLTTYAREQYPDVAKLPITVEIRKRDDQSGTALGALHVTSEEAGKEVLVPFIVRKFELCPLDIWMEPKSQQVHPLTKDTFKEVFFVQSPADGMDARPADSSGTYFNDPSLWTTNYPPLQGRYSYASAGYPILDQLSDSFTKEDAEEFKQTLRDNPHSVVKFKKHGHAEILEKLAKKTYPLASDYTASAMKLIPTAAVSIKKEDQDQYSVLACSEGLFDTGAVQKMDRAHCEKFLSRITGKPQDFLNEVDQEGEKMLIVRKPAEGIFLYDKDEAGPEEAKEFAVYTAKTKKTGLMLNGVVIPNVVDFAGNKRRYKIFLSPDHSSFQPSIAGVRSIGTNDKTTLEKVLRPADIRVGQTGCFVYLMHGKALATEPVTIKSIEEYGPLTVVDMNGKRFHVRRGYGHEFGKEVVDKKSMLTQPGGGHAKKDLESMGFAELKKDHFIIPSKMMWIPMGDLREVVASPAEWMQKEAAAKMEIDPLTLRWTGIEYDVTGAGLPKLALDECATKLLLANAGVGVDKIAKVLKKAKSSGRVKVHGVDRLRSKGAKTSETATLIAKVASVITSLKRNLIKEAAEVPDDNATVDVLLSLNFLNADNLAKFVAYKPVFDKVLDYLAELTLAARLGLKDVHEGSIVTAMAKLMEVSEGLHKLQVSMKRPSTKTAAALPHKKGKQYLPSKRGKLLAAIGG